MPTPTPKGYADVFFTHPTVGLDAAAEAVDPMILPRYSQLLAGLIPGSAQKTYPDATHGFLFQHHAEFADDVLAILD